MRLLFILIKKPNERFDKLPAAKRQEYFYFGAVAFFVTWMFAKIFLLNYENPFFVDIFFLLLMIVIFIPRYLYIKKII